MRTKIFLLIGLILVNTLSFAQTSTKVNYKRLRIGDKVPDDFVFAHMVNYPGGRATMADFKGKVVILDFWNLNCTACIEAFPKMQQLQEKFSGQIQILLVNVLNTWEILENKGFPYHTKSPIIPHITLPFVLNTRQVTNEDILDEKVELFQMFPHFGEPYHVWIDTAGFVRGNSKGLSVTEKSIEYFLHHNKMMSTAGEVLMPADLGIQQGMEHASILQPQNEYVRNSIVYSSAIFKDMGVATGMSTSLIDSSTGKAVGSRSKPRDILGLYVGNAIKGGLPMQERIEFNKLISENRIFLDVRDPTSYIQPKDPSETSTWRAENIYIYELRMPVFRTGTSWEENETMFSRIMQQDLERFFGIHSYLEKRKVRCWVLTRMSRMDKLATKGEPPFIGRASYAGGEILRNSSLRNLLEHIQRRNQREGFIPIRPFVNETGFSWDKKIDITITASLEDIEGLKNDLRKYDLDLIEAERELEMLVISDKSISEKNNN